MLPGDSSTCKLGKQSVCEVRGRGEIGANGKSQTLSRAMSDFSTTGSYCHRGVAPESLLSEKEMQDFRDLGCVKL